MVHDASATRRPTRWLVDSAVVCSRCSGSRPRAFSSHIFGELLRGCSERVLMSVTASARCSRTSPDAGLLVLHDELVHRNHLREGGLTLAGVRAPADVILQGSCWIPG